MIKPPSRLTVVEQICHQDGLGEPITASHQFSRTLFTDEQPWVRKFMVGLEWKPPELGWLSDGTVGVLHIINEEGRNLQRIPTVEEKEELAERIIELGLDRPGSSIILFAIVFPGESCHFQPSDPSSLRIRCRNGIARCTLTAIPG